MKRIFKLYLDSNQKLPELEEYMKVCADPKFLSMNYNEEESNELARDIYRCALFNIFILENDIEKFYADLKPVFELGGEIDDIIVKLSKSEEGINHETFPKLVRNQLGSTKYREARKLGLIQVEA
ncbi:hypothetical protein RF11_16099 [Thelohanellus kitauei]|uniref:Uncharacterized protein n=1 Tax=Thelohanellus kitauei TaxID=669202 RepID=A0A0C2J9B2_THEKT|nr:hypothetical protein RF11_16099 [Thelohanellus kitauei]